MADKFNSRDRQRHHGDDTDSEFGGRISVHRTRQMNDGDYKFQGHREQSAHDRKSLRPRHHDNDDWRSVR